MWLVGDAKRLQRLGNAINVVVGLCRLGAAVAVELIADHTPLLTLLFTTFIISSRHFLYGLAVRQKVISQPLRWRLPVSFVLTDELFAFSPPPQGISNEKHALFMRSALALAFMCGLEYMDSIGHLGRPTITRFNQFRLRLCHRHYFYCLGCAHHKKQSNLSLRGDHREFAPPLFKAWGWNSGWYLAP